MPPLQRSLLLDTDTDGKNCLIIILVIIIIIILIIIGKERSYPENSIVGDSKDTKKSTVLVRRKKRETWYPW